MRVVFLGTPAFAVPTLEALLAAGHEVICVVTQPDRPSGRGRQLSASPVKEAALRHALPVYQPERVRRPEAMQHLAALAPDAMVVVGYGQIIPQSIIDIPPHGIINVHGSLLPKYRGAGPIQWAIANGETRTGVTTMRIDAGLDTGDMLLKAETDIGPDETAIELGARLATAGAALLVQTLASIGSIVPEKQDPAQATYAPLLKKEDGLIGWHQPAQAIHNRVRGFQPWPGAYTRFRGRQLHIWKSRVVAHDTREPVEAGRLLLHPLRVVCGEGALELIEVQLEGRNRIPAEAFTNGQRIAIDSDAGILGES
jgi:methionyl-tRNA formyltransferase